MKKAPFIDIHTVLSVFATRIFAVQKSFLMHASECFDELTGIFGL